MTTTTTDGTPQSGNALPSLDDLARKAQNVEQFRRLIQGNVRALQELLDWSPYDIVSAYFRASRRADRSTIGNRGVRVGRGGRSRSDPLALSAPDPASLAAAKRGAQQAAASILDSYKLRNGKPIGDCTRVELEMLAGENLREGFLCRLILRRAAHVPSEAVVRDWCSEDDLKRAIQKAAEAEDAI